MDIKMLRHKATEVALKHFFCDIDTDEELQGLMEFYESGFDIDETTVRYVVWYPFEHYDADELYAVVTNLMVSIIDTFTEREPNNNNGGYVGAIVVS